MSRIYPVMTVALLALALVGCGNEDKGSYEKNKKSLAQIEQDSPGRFLRVDLEERKNIIGQTVLKGKVVNTAKVVIYKDIEIEFSFFNGSGTLLERDREMLNKEISPGTYADFKFKYFSPKGSDSVATRIITAASCRAKSDSLHK